jgi:hypothetical protein
MTALPLPFTSPDIAPRLRQQDASGVLVVTAQGVFDDAALHQLDEVLGATPRRRPAAIDLTECALAEPSVLQQLDPRRWARSSTDVCVVCHRLTGRRLMMRTGMAHRFSLFASVEDALRSHRSSSGGSGAGWDHRRR